MELIKKINNLRPDKKKVKKNREHAHGYVDALNDVIEIVRNNSHLHSVNGRLGIPPIDIYCKARECELPSQFEEWLEAKKI